MHLPLGPLLLVAAMLPPPAGRAPVSSAQVLTERSGRPAEEGVARPDLEGVPSPTQLFFMVGGENGEVVRALPDVNGDGRDEVLVGIGESGTDNVFCLDGASSGAATVEWSLETNGGVSGGSAYGDQSIEAVSDGDGNGSREILLGTAWGGRTAYRLDGEAGAELWRLDTYMEPDSGWIYSLAEMDDSTGDGVPEAAFGAGSDNDGVYYVDGMSSGQATVLWRYQAADGVGSVRNLGDADGDGVDDVLAGLLDFGDAMLALDGGTSNPAGNLLWSYPTGGASIFAVGVMPDTTGDGVAEALAAVWASDGSSVRCVDGASGTEVWASTDVPTFGMLVDLLEDVTGDGVPEVVVSSWDNAVNLLDGADGSRVWRSEVGTLNGGDVWSARAIGDLNGDGREDVVAGSFDLHVYAMDGTTGEILWAFDTGNRVFSVAPVGDLDGDGRPDVAVGTQDTTTNVVVHVLSGGTGPVTIFADGFESGDTSAWTSTTG